MKNSMRRMALCAYLLMVIAQPTMAEQRIKLQSSTITGNSELPKILYVVPWKQVESTKIDYQLSVRGITDDVLKPIDPEEFRQQAKNYAELLDKK